MTSLSEQKIQRILRFQYMTNPRYVAENLFVFKWESDFLFKTRSGYWHEVEIKISFSDFKNDAKNKKEKFEILETGQCVHKGFVNHNKRPNYFSYCVTEDMVERVKYLIPEYAGLFYVEEKTHLLVKVKAPKKLHPEKIDDNILKLTEKFYYNYRSWKSCCDGWMDEERKLKSKIRFLEKEYKAATGYDIKDVF